MQTVSLQPLEYSHHFLSNYTRNKPGQYFLFEDTKKS